MFRARDSLLESSLSSCSSPNVSEPDQVSMLIGKCMNCVVQDKKCSLVSNSQYHMCSSWHCLTVANCWPPPHTIIWISAGDDVLINYKCGRQMSRLISTPLTPVHAPLSPVIADCGSSVSPDWDQAAGRLLTRASNGGSRRFHNHGEGPFLDLLLVNIRQ